MTTSGTTFRRISQDFHVLELSLAAAIFVIIYSLRQKKRHGLPVWPYVGMLPSMLLGLRTNVYEWVTEILVRQGGTFVFKGPSLTNLNCIVTADPRNLEHMLKNRFSSFPKGDYHRYILHDLLGDGIFNSDHEVWRHQRKTASLNLHTLEFQALTASSLLQLVHFRLFPVLEEAMQKGSHIDLQNLLLRLTFDNISMIAFGVDPGCLTPELPQIPFARAFEDATEASTLRFITPTAVWRVMRFLNVGVERKLSRAIKKVDEFARGVIRARRKELELESDNKVDSRSDLLTVFMRLKDDAELPFSDKFLRDICVNFILAGRDTSAVAMVWFFWLINQNPAVEERILSEVRGIISERENPEKDGDVTSGFRPAEVKKMEYLQAALSEALRLYPSVPVGHKEVDEDEVFPDGLVLKKGNRILYSVYTMGRMESIWGADCREFKPERWLKDGRFIGESAYKFAAFNGGPRLCIGKEFAYYQMKFVAASIIYRYKLQVVENHPVVPKLGLTIYMKHGLKVKLSSRESHLKVGS